MRARHHLIRPRVLLCALAIAVAALPVEARELSAQEAVAKVQQETSGKVLSVQTLTMGKRKFYRIKVLTREGSVRRVLVSADGKDGDPPKNDAKGGAAPKADRSGKSH